MNAPVTVSRSTNGTWIEQALQEGACVLYLQGQWRLENLQALASEIQSLRLAPELPCVLDGTRLEALDTSSSFVLLARLGTAGYTRSMVSIRHVAPRHARLLQLVHERMDTAPVPTTSRHEAPLQRLGAAAVHAASDLQAHVQFLGLVVLETLALVTRPRLFRARETVAQFQIVALDAIPIIALMTVLMGVVFAYLLGEQARRYGATMFVVDGVGLAMCRELAPTVAAVIVAGRSGAAFTAQLGAMKVQEETDAIRTLGLSPIQVLVIPRLIAITVGLPLLVFVGDVAGVLGGMFISSLQFQIMPAAFAQRLHAVLPLSAVVVGLVKAPVFALFIGLIACRMGLTVTRDARSVGMHTTSTVVQGIVWVIVLDSMFAVALQILGI